MTPYRAGAGFTAWYPELLQMLSAHQATGSERRVVCKNRTIAPLQPGGSPAPIPASRER